MSGHFGIGGTTANMSYGQFGTGAEVSWVQSVCTPNKNQQQCYPTTCFMLLSTVGQALVTGQLADTPTRGLPKRGLDISRTGQLAD